MNWLRRLIDLVLPRTCAGCGRGGVDALCPACLPVGPPLPGAAGALAAGAYAGALRAALLRYKERGRRDLARPLGLLLARAAAGVIADRSPPRDAGRTGGTVLVPVPSRRAAAAARGGDHVRRLAGHAAGELGLPLATPLRLARAGRDSAGLSAPDRARERRHSMVARAPLPDEIGRVAVIVDDIVTTGATLHESMRALRAAGWLVIGSATVATTPRISATRGVTIGRAQVIGLA